LVLDDGGGHAGNMEEVAKDIDLLSQNVPVVFILA
jgi:hypothetical protein